MQARTQHDFEQAAKTACRDTGIALQCTGTQQFGTSLHAARYRLGNGLTVILVPDHRAPILAYQTWFKVGSKHEDPQRTGLAHLFEHLMFKGTRRHPTGEFDREMERRGSQTNAATWVDWTYYTEALAARDDNLATVIDFEADRMTGLVLDHATFASELEVVKNERRMSVEDSVVGTLSEHLLALAYHQHPYRWPTIGSMQHLEAASVADLEQFYRANYAPNNATVVLVGDVEIVPALCLLARGYGHLAAQPLARPARPVEPAQNASRQSVIVRPVMAPQMVVGYHAPAQDSPDFAALEMLGEILVAGDTARLYQRLVTDAQLATEVGGFAAPFAEPGLFEFHVAARPGVEPQEVIDVLQQELDAVATGISASEINKARNGLELALLDGLKDVEGCAEQFGHYETNYGDFGMAVQVMSHYEKVDHAALCRVARSIFRSTNRSTVIALPDKKEV